MIEPPDTYSSARRVVVLSSGAAAELAEAVAWYEAQSPGLGIELLGAVDAVRSLIQRHSDAGKLVRPRIRRALLKRFPYGVFYTEFPDRIQVIAIIHSRKHPARWPRRA
jgi:toxin ParE1/3/4